MLERLEVRGLGIIDSAVLEPAPGFVALTGETGAGKSLLVESLKLLEGQRAQSDMVRSGEARLRVEGWFQVSASTRLEAVLTELGLEDHDPTEPLVIRREVSAEGRSRAWINDTGVTVTALQRLAPLLLSIHGQHEQYGLADSEVQRDLVDEFGTHQAELQATADAFERWQEAAAEAQRLEAARARRRDRLDAISRQLAEIDSVAPEPGEDESLRQRRQVLRHAVRLLELSESFLDRAADREDAVIEELARAGRELEEMRACGLDVGDAVSRLDDARVLVEDVVREVQDVVGDVQQDPNELETVESRLHRLEQLMLRYGSPAEKVLEHRQALLEERAEMGAVEERLEAAQAAARSALEEYREAATALAVVRREAGVRLAGEVEQVLGRLNMGGTRLELRWQTTQDGSSPLEWEARPVRFDAAGVEWCELMIAANPGEEPRPMARIASGGELSRLHLAMRSVLRARRSDGSPAGLTLLFDEVDSGLGGGTAAALACLLAELAEVDQVLVVTHLPQVAARAGGHLKIEKVIDGARAVTRVMSLEPAAREQELARMLAGDRIGESALSHARSLLEGR